MTQLVDAGVTLANNQVGDATRLLVVNPCPHLIHAALCTAGSLGEAQVCTPTWPPLHQGTARSLLTRC